jgi:toxin-antitoxin system PIN domain toxin
MLVDSNILLFAVDEHSRFQPTAREWLEGALRGTERVGLPWQSLGAFLRLSTNPRVYGRPLTSEVAWAQVSNWLALDTTWIPNPGPSYAEILGRLVLEYDVRGNLVPDAQLAALALEHGLAVCSADTDFARFTEVEWVHPLA